MRQRQLTNARHFGNDVSTKRFDIRPLKPQPPQVGSLQLGAGILQVRQDLGVVLDGEAEGEFQPPRVGTLQDEECEALERKQGQSIPQGAVTLCRTTLGKMTLKADGITPSRRATTQNDT